MQNNYEIQETGIYKQTYYVKETQTNQCVGKFNKLCDARIFARKLNQGSGFNGWTPSFVLRSVSEILQKSE